MTSTRIHIVTPIVGEVKSLDYLASLDTPDFQWTASALQNGPVSIECDTDSAYATPGLMEEAKKAEAEGADAIVINCMGDPGLSAVRESVAIPVVGCGQTAMHTAATLGQKFSVLPTLGRRKVAYQVMARNYGLLDRLASVRPVDVAVQSIQSDDSAKDRLVACAKAAVLDDGADVLILGCTQFASLVDDLREQLGQVGIAPPILVGLPLAVLAARNLAKLKLTHSSIAYPPAEVKPVIGY